MKKNVLKAFSLLTAAICLCGCSNEQNNGYVDVSDYINSIENNSNIENTDIFADHQFDDKSIAIMTSEYSVNEDVLYAAGIKNLRIDGQSGEVRALCSKAGCAHEPNSPDCTAFRIMRTPLSSPNGIYYCNDNKLCLYDGKDNKVILENRFCTEYEEEAYPDSKYNISVMYGDGLFYLKGATYYFTYDPSNGERSDPIVISKSNIYSMDVGGGNIYYTTDSAELHIYNISTGEQKKAADNIWKLDYVNERLYYTGYENGVPMLYSADKNGGDVKKIIEDCYVNCCVTENCIYYQNYSDPDKSVFVCGIDGSNPKKIVFPKLKIIDENGEEREETQEYQVGLVNIITSGSSDKVFMVSLDRIYSFDKGSEKSELISVAEHWVYEDAN